MNHDSVHLVIDNHSSLFKIDRIDRLVVSIILIAIEILRRSSVTRVVEEESVVRSSIFDQPLHRSQLKRKVRSVPTRILELLTSQRERERAYDIGSSRGRHRVGLARVEEHDDIFLFVVLTFAQPFRHVSRIVVTSS